MEFLLALTKMIVIFGAILLAYGSAVSIIHSVVDRGIDYIIRRDKIRRNQ
jgi:hypothetical protein